MDLLFASKKAIGLQRVEAGIYGSMSELDSEKSFRLLNDFVAPHGLRLSKPEDEYVKEVSGEA
jgi:hypothetical protein